MKSPWRWIVAVLSIVALLVTEQGFSFYAAAEDVIGGPKGVPQVFLGVTANEIPRVSLHAGLDQPVGLTSTELETAAGFPQAQLVPPSGFEAPLATRVPGITAPSTEIGASVSLPGVEAQTRDLDKTLQHEREAGDVASFSGHVFDGIKRTPESESAAWWKDPTATRPAVTVPIYALRRAKDDPGIGKFTDLGTYYREVLAKDGVDTVLLLPHFAVLDESPYAAVSVYAVNEDNVDWSRVPEVAKSPELLESLKAAPSQGQAVDYTALREREAAVGQEAYALFAREHLAQGTARAAEFRDFVAHNGSWLKEYAEFMSLSRIIRKPALDWTTADVEAARRDSRFTELSAMHSYTQWLGYNQLHAALDDIHAAGGHAMFDLPMFRGKNSVDAWKRPEEFTDLRTRNPGIKNKWLDDAGKNEDWKDLALWNWTRAGKDGYRVMTDPFAHWLDFGFDGARVDALHFAYKFGNGQFPSGDEPGDAYVEALGAMFKSRGAFPLAEAFEGKAADAERHGFVTVYGDWKKISSHDDPRFPGFMGRFLGFQREGSSGKNSKFIAYTLGDEWGDPFTVKEDAHGGTRWRYRIPLPSDGDYANRARVDARPQLTVLKSLREGNVWKDAQAVDKALAEAADSFVKHADGSTQIWAASMDWFLEEWGRDTFISLPGLLLSTGRHAEAKEVMRRFARFEHDGLIPNKIWDASRWTKENPDGADYNTVDGPLWFIQSVKKYEEATGDKAFLMEMAPVLGRIVSRYQSGTGYERYGRFNKIAMDADGLIMSPAQATWMDADPEGRDRPVTPRNGKAVEINALWYSGLRFLADVEREHGDAAAARAHDALADQVQKSFKAKFYFETPDNKKAWGGTGGALRDVIEGDIHSGAIRPNMLFAVSHGGDLLSPNQQKAVVLAAVKDMLTPYGLRTLSYRDSQYQARYDTSQPAIVKDQAYHQGTVWPWLMGPFLDALARVRQSQGWDEGRITSEARGMLTALVEFLVTHPEGSLPEVFDGGGPDQATLNVSLDDPKGLGDVFKGRSSGQNPGGTRSQAWSVAEVLRILSRR